MIAAVPWDIPTMIASITDDKRAFDDAEGTSAEISCYYSAA
jgi:hypothetical protein